MRFAAPLVVPFRSLFPLWGNFALAPESPSCLHRNSPMDTLCRRECQSFYPFEGLREGVPTMSPAAGAKLLKARRLKSTNGRAQKLLKSGTFPPPTGGKNSVRDQPILVYACTGSIH